MKTQKLIVDDQDFIFFEDGRGDYEDVLNTFNSLSGPNNRGNSGKAVKGTLPFRSGSNPGAAALEILDPSIFYKDSTPALYRLGNMMRKIHAGDYDSIPCGKRKGGFDNARCEPPQKKSHRFLRKDQFDIERMRLAWLADKAHATLQEEIRQERVREDGIKDLIEI